MRGLARREAVAVNADARRGGQLHPGGVVVQRDGVVAGLRPLARVAEAGTVAGAGLRLVAGIELHLAGDRHQEHVAEVGVSRAREVGVGEALDGVVAVAVAGRVGVAVVEVADPSVGGKLHHAEGSGRARVGVAVRPRADEGVDGAVGGRGVGVGGRGRQERRAGEEDG